MNGLLPSKSHDNGLIHVLPKKAWIFDRIIKMFCEYLRLGWVENGQCLHRQSKCDNFELSQHPRIILR